MRSLLVLVTALLLLTGCSSSTSVEKPASDELPDVTLAALDGGKPLDLGRLKGPAVVNLWASWCGPCKRELPSYAAFAKKYAGKVDVLGIDFQETRPSAARDLARKSGVTYPLFKDPDGRMRAVGLPKLILVDRDHKVTYQEYVEITSLAQLEKLVQKHLGGDSMSFPDWLEPIREGASTISAEDISRFVPPEGSDARKGAVLMLFGEGPKGPDLLLTERAHDMRSHPGQVSFPGGSIDETDASATAAALREAEEETGLDPGGVEVFATLPELWLPPSNFAVTAVLGWWREESPVGVVDPAEVNAVVRVPLEELLDPTHRVTVTHPLGYSSPGWLIGEDKDLILWGFTAGLVNRLFDHVGLTRPWDASVTHPLPDYMLGLSED